MEAPTQAFLGKGTEALRVVVQNMSFRHSADNRTCVHFCSVLAALHSLPLIPPYPRFILPHSMFSRRTVYGPHLCSLLFGYRLALPSGTEDAGGKNLEVCLLLLFSSLCTLDNYSFGQGPCPQIPSSQSAGKPFLLPAPSVQGVSSGFLIFPVPGSSNLHADSPHSAYTSINNCFIEFLLNISFEGAFFVQLRP